MLYTIIGKSAATSLPMLNITLSREKNMKTERIVIAQRPNKTIYVEDGKLYKEFDKTFKKSDVLNEAINQARIEEAGLSIPKIYDVNINKEGNYSIVMEYIEGESLDELMKKHPEKIDEYLRLFVQIQKDMHEYNVPLLNRTKEKFTRKLREANLDGSTKYELQMRLEGMPTHFKLCHGDYDPTNIIIDKAGKPHILDWSHATTGNGSADASRTYLLFKLRGQDELAQKYMDLYCEMTHTTRHYVTKWLPIVAASQSVKGKPEEREFLLQWATIAEYE